jgi:hypothetical protein
MPNGNNVLLEKEMTATIYFTGLLIVATLAGALVFSTDETEPEDLLAVGLLSVFWPFILAVLAVGVGLIVALAVIGAPGFLIGTLIRKIND